MRHDAAPGSGDDHAAAVHLKILCAERTDDFAQGHTRRDQAAFERCDFGFPVLVVFPSLDDASEDVWAGDIQHPIGILVSLLFSLFSRRPLDTPEETLTSFSSLKRFMRRGVVPSMVTWMLNIKTPCIVLDCQTALRPAGLSPAWERTA